MKLSERIAGRIGFYGGGRRLDGALMQELARAARELEAQVSQLTADVLDAYGCCDDMIRFVESCGGSMPQTKALIEEKRQKLAKPAWRADSARLGVTEADHITPVELVDREELRRRYPLPPEVTEEDVSRDLAPKETT